jgi:hypothetical protein
MRRRASLSNLYSSETATNNKNKAEEGDVEKANNG